MPVRMPKIQALFSGTVNNAQAVRGVAADLRGHGPFCLYVDNQSAQICTVEIYLDLNGTAAPTAITSLYQLEKEDGSALRTLTIPATTKCAFPIDVSCNYALLRAALAASTGTVVLSVHASAISGGSNVGFA